jgi:glyceraldehyde 3-phosphate dehydrogenase
MSDKINIGIMGFGHIGRYIYENTLNSNLFQVKVISDIGDINSLNYLLNNNLRNKKIGVSIEDESFVYNGEKTKFVNGISPGDVNWGDYDVDWVIDATGKFLDKLVLDKHIESGANRVILASLPNNELDNLIIPGLNELDINENDKIISAGSSTTNAFGLMLKALNEFSEIECCSLTTIHSYTSDQPLLDIANTDLKRSRSAAKNIIPNYNFSSRWIEKILPEFKNKIFSTALNVPVQFGSLLDMTTVFKNDFENEEQVNFAIDKLALKFPSFIKVISDPIVSSDVIGMKESLVFDRLGTLKVGNNMIKTLAWYDNGYNHASRVLDVISLYEGLK